MVTLPEYLKPGDIIGIVCPSGHLAPGQAQACIGALQAWGYQVRMGKTLDNASGNYFAGTDGERLYDLQDMLDDDAVRAVLCARGGYGLSRIIDQVRFNKFMLRPKWIIGFSDVTILHAHIFSNCQVSTLHAPMCAAFNEQGSDRSALMSLQQALAGEMINYSCAPHPFNRMGQARGELVGGNLSILAHLTGTPSDIRTKNKILFLEDIGEYLYQVDRMLYQLKRSGKLDGLAGLVIGGFTGMKDTARPFGQSVPEIILDVVSAYDYPVCFDFPVGHQPKNYALKMGAVYTLKIGKDGVGLTE